MSEFAEILISPRARHMALWLCDLSNPALDRRSRDASCEMLLRELPDFWTADEAYATSAEVRMKLGPKAPTRAWLAAMNWLVGEEERLPERGEQPSRYVTQTRVREMAAVLLRKIEPATPRRRAVAVELDDNAAWAASVVAAVKQQGHPLRVVPRS